MYNEISKLTPDQLKVKGLNVNAPNFILSRKECEIPDLNDLRISDDEISSVSTKEELFQ